MTALYITAAIIFLIWLILFQFVTVDFSFLSGQLKVKVKYLFITVFDLNKYLDKKKAEAEKETVVNEESLSTEEAKTLVSDEPNLSKAKVKSKEKQKKENVSGSVDKSTRKVRKKTIEDRLFEIGDKIEFIQELCNIGKRPVLKILRGIHLTKLFIDFDIADEDAYDCAIKFGRMNALVFNAVGSLACLFSVKKKSIDIHCVYDASPARYDASFYLKLRPTTVLGAGLNLGIKYLIYFVIKPKLARRKAKKNKRIAAKTKTA